VESEDEEIRLTGSGCVASQRGLVASCLFLDAEVWASRAVFVACLTKSGLRDET